MVLQLYGQSWVVATEAKGPANPKPFTIQVFTENACQPSSREMVILLSLGFLPSLAAIERWRGRDSEQTSCTAVLVLDSLPPVTAIRGKPNGDF